MEIHRPDKELILGNRRIRYSSRISRSEFNIFYLEYFLKEKGLYLSDLNFETYLLSNKQKDVETTLENINLSAPFLTSTIVSAKDAKTYINHDYLLNETTYSKAVDVYRNDILLGESTIPIKLEDGVNSSFISMSVESLNKYGIPSKVRPSESKGFLDFTSCDLNLKEKLRFSLRLSKRISWKDKILISLFSSQTLKSCKQFYYRTIYECPYGREFEQLKPGDPGYQDEIERARKLFSLS